MEIKKYRYEIRPVPYDPWDITTVIATASTKVEAERLLETYQFMRDEELMITTHEIRESNS